MTETIAVPQAITRLSDVESRFNLRQSRDPEFFSEWKAAMPELVETEMISLDFLRSRYLRYLEDEGISESTVNIIILSPLINLAKLCDLPYRIRGEKWVKLEVEMDDGTEVLEGRIDALTIQKSLQSYFWLVVIEAKKSGFSVLRGVPQTLVYMMANPDRDSPLFGMVTNGEDYLFLKLDRTINQYTFSKKLTLVNPESNELYQVVQILRHLLAL
ncbi:MAG: type I restriction endonuclease subunit R [Microcoleaceae cyanobacterium]